jgi:hypothetical protein
VKDILSALEGDTVGLAEKGVVLGDAVPVCTPRKLENGKSILASDDEQAGVVIYRTELSVLIIVFKQDPESADRLAAQIAAYMAENGH